MSSVGKELHIPLHTDPHAVTGLMKQYIRELPEPIFTFELYDQFLEIERNPTIENYHEQVKNLIKMLPEDNR